MFELNKINTKYGIRDKIAILYGKDILKVSSIRWEDIFQYFLDTYIKKVNAIVEIGTNCGIGTILLSKYAEKIYTFDKVDYPERKKTWEKFGINNAIFYKIKNDKEKEEILKTLNFQFAFIDGCHHGVEVDYELLKHCGKILFHDYETGWVKDNFRTIVVRLVNSLIKDVKEINEPFAYWEV